MTRAVYDPRRWLTVDPPLKNSPGKRSPEALRSVVAQFDVVHNPRFQRSTNATWCNIFLWDVTCSMQCEIPHWIESSRRLGSDPPDTSRAGDPSQLPNPGAAYDPAAPVIARVELSANGVVDWLAQHGSRFGWTAVDRPFAGACAARGEPVAAVWANSSGGPGHVAILLPPLGTQLRIAQAGAHNLYDAPLEAGFGSLPARFYAHP